MNLFFQSPIINVFLFSIFWSLEIFVTKLAFLSGAQLIPFSIQSTFATLLILAVFVLPKKFKEIKKLSFTVIKWLLIANAIHMGLGGFLSYAGIQLTTAVNAGFLSQFTIVTGVLFGWIIVEEKITLTKIVSVLFALLGTFLLLTDGKLITPHVGDIFLITACIFWGYGGSLIRKTLKNHPAVNADIVTLFRPIAGIPVMLLLILFSPLYPESMQKTFRINFMEISHIFYVILNSILIVLTWIFVNRTLKYANTSYTAIMGSITPILVAIMAIVFLNEGINFVQLVGTVFIILASFITERKKTDRI